MPDIDHVAICGLPSSGNRMVRAFFLQAGIPSNQAMIFHGLEPDKSIFKRMKRGGTWGVIHLMRDPYCWARSCEVRGMQGANSIEDSFERVLMQCYETLLPVLAKLACELPTGRVIPLTYEAVLKNPVELMGWVLRQWSLPTDNLTPVLPQMGPVRDENEKWYVAMERGE